MKLSPVWMSRPLYSAASTRGVDELAQCLVRPREKEIFTHSGVRFSGMNTVSSILNPYGRLAKDAANATILSNSSQMIMIFATIFIHDESIKCKHIIYV